MSVVLGTIIMAAVILTVTIAASYFSANVLNMQLDSTEFEQGKNTLLSLADMVEDISTSPLSAHYIHVNLRTSRPIFKANAGTISVDVSGFISPPIQSMPVSIVEIRGGSLTGTVNSILLGSNSLIVSDISSPLAAVNEYQSSGALLTLDFSRVRVTNLGCFYYYDAGGGISGYLNTVRITFIQLIVGRTTGTSSMDIIVNCVGTTLNAITTASNTVTVTVTDNNGNSQSLQINGLSTINVNGKIVNVKGTIVQVLTTQVQVSSQ